MPLVHVMRPGETLLSVADLYGFRAWQTIAEAPENEAVIERRGNPHALCEGDELHIPDGQIGECLVPTGSKQSAQQAAVADASSHHKVVLKTHKPLLEIRVFCEFRRVPEGVVAGAKKGTILGWNRGTTHLTVEEATISVTPGNGRTGSTNRHGILRVEALTDGKWTLRLDPHADELSPGPTLPDNTRDHGLDRNKGNVKRKRERGSKKSLEVEYRPLDLEIEVAGDAITGVQITSGKRDDRPHHAVCFWHDGVEPGPRGVTQVLEIDLKADFMRRIKAGGSGVLPKISKRAKEPGIRLFEVHHTTGNEIGSTIAEFTNNTSGIHFLNDRDGHVVRMVDDHHKVTHGGGKNGAVENAWADETEINDQAIGCENVQGHDAVFPDAQIAALIGLIRRARELYPAIVINHVIGHCDVYTGKLECPGPLFPWEKLEKAGVALQPTTLTDAQMASEWGGLFAGEAGQKRMLKEGDQDRKDDDGTFSVVRKGKVIASSLTVGPVALLNECLHSIGYTPNRNDKKVANYDKWKVKNLATFGRSTRVAITFFKAHYCTDTRKSPLTHPFVDLHLAKLVLGCYRALPT
jgi:N-acetyl-anhydromuramyl-L-alanine amidase AmpD